MQNNQHNVPFRRHCEEEIIENIKSPSGNGNIVSSILFLQSPAGLYQTLASMKNNGSADAPNIEIGVKKYANTSNGECN